MNRKLIRTTLAEVKERELHREHHRHMPPPPPPQMAQPAQPKKKVPPEQTNAESFYYKKQMDSHTPMVVVLQDGETLTGIIEWYDKGSLKLHRDDAPNVLILKHNIKYLYKDKDQSEEKEK
jgi:host factor-I protein